MVGVSVIGDADISLNGVYWTLPSCKSKPSIYKLFFAAMASHCEVCLAASDPLEAQALAQFAIAEVKRIEAKYSRYRPDSVISAITAQAGLDWVVCDDETLYLMDYADGLFKKSGGLFDVTSGVLRRAWKFQEAKLPTPQTLQNLCGLVNWSSVQRDGRHFRLPQLGMELDFGGFGKEYAADHAAQAIQAHGVTHGYVNLAGDIRVIGPRPDGQPWVIGIQDPRCPDKLIANIALTHGAIATSGDYERYFDLDSRRFCHILDPHDGLPVDFWRSVSVSAPSAMVAGGLATIAMLKQNQALAFLENENVLYLAVEQSGRQHSKLAA